MLSILYSISFFSFFFKTDVTPTLKTQNAYQASFRKFINSLLSYPELCKLQSNHILPDFPMPGFSLSIKHLHMHRL